MKQSALSLLFLLLSSALFAQTTYHGQLDFVCDAASAHPVQYYSQFTCRGIALYDSSGNNVGSYYFSTYYGYLRVNLPGIAPWPSSNDTITKIDAFSIPMSQPGDLHFEAVFTDAHGVTHSATVSATWKDFVMCGGRGCYWHAPELLSNSLTINN